MSSIEVESRPKSIGRKIVNVTGRALLTTVVVGWTGWTGYSYADFYVLNSPRKIEQRAKDAFPQVIPQKIIDNAVVDVVAFNQEFQNFQRNEPERLRKSMLAGDSSMLIPKLANPTKTQESIEIFNAEKKRLEEMDIFRNEEYHNRKKDYFRMIFGGGVTLVMGFFVVNNLITKLEKLQKKLRRQ